jgi:hypothetical protein
MSAGNSIFGKIRAQFDVDEITTADDTGTAGTPGGKMVEVFEGTGSNYVRSLPAANATGMFVGWSRRFVNASEETIIIKNSGAASSLMVWLMSGETLDVMCTNIASAAGAWSRNRSKLDPHLGIDWWDDLISNTAGTSLWRRLAAGGGAAMGDSDAIGANKDGYGLTRCGTSVGGYGVSLAPSGPSLIFGDGPVLLETTCAFQELSTATEEYIFRIGFGDSVDAAEPVDGVYLEYDRATNGDVWATHTSANSTRTKTPRAVAPVLYATAMQAITIAIKSNASRADFWIDRTHLGTMTANIPTGVVRATAVMVQGTKTVGSTNRFAATLYAGLRKAYTANWR